jgi:hypothetical protein
MNNWARFSLLGAVCSAAGTGMALANGDWTGAVVGGGLMLVCWVLAELHQDRP